MLPTNTFLKAAGTPIKSIILNHIQYLGLSWQVARTADKSSASSDLSMPRDCYNNPYCYKKIKNLLCISKQMYTFFIKLSQCLC